MRELKDIKTPEQKEAFELYASYGLNLDFELPDLTKAYFAIIKDSKSGITSEKALIHYKELQNLLRFFRKREQEEKLKIEESKSKVKENIEFLESVGVDVKSHIDVEKIIPVVEVAEEEKSIGIEEIFSTDEAKFFEPGQEEEHVIVENSTIGEQSIEVEEVKEVKKEQPKEIKPVVPEEIKTVEIEKIKSEPKEKSFDMSELSYVDSGLTDIEKFAASYFEKPVEHTKKIIYADESNKVKTDLQEFKTVEMPKEEPKEIVKIDLSGILDDSYQTKTENFNKRHEEVKVDFGDLGNVEEEKQKNQNTINDDVPVDDDDPFIFGFTSIKK